MIFIIIFILIPLAEIFVFINVSDHIGLGTALLIALLTAILGGMIVKYQGIQTLITAQTSLQNGGIPSKELFDGLCLVAAGATLITPGFITDAIGFALLVPAIRNYLRKRLTESAKLKGTGFHAEYREFHATNSNAPKDPNIIDVEYETIKEEKEDKT